MILPNEKIIFVGDLIVKDQPPFIASANLAEWAKSLDYLQAHFQDFRIVSGRGNLVSLSSAQVQRKMISTIHDQLENLARKQAGMDAVENLIQPLMVSIQAPSERQKQYTQRLLHGLRHYFARHYRSSSLIDESEE